MSTAFLWLVYVLCVLAAMLTLPSYAALLYGFVSWLGGAVFTLLVQRWGKST